MRDPDRPLVLARAITETYQATGKVSTHLALELAELVPDILASYQELSRAFRNAVEQLDGSW